jgi:hypothetical protein
LIGIAVAIDMRDYAALTLNNRGALSKLGETPFYLGYDLAMRQAAKEIRDGGMTDVVAFVCDSHETYSKRMLSVHEELQMSNPDLPIGSLTYAKDIDMCQLQAADLIIYELRKEVERLWRRPDKATRTELKSLQDSLNIGALFICQKACLQDFLDGVE